MRSPRTDLEWWRCAQEGDALHGVMAHTGGVTYLWQANAGLDQIERVFLVEGPSLACGSSLAPMAQQLLSVCHRTLIVVVDVHLTRPKEAIQLRPRRFTIRDRGSRHASNLRKLQWHFPDAQMISIGSSLGALIALHARMLCGHRIRNHLMLLISPLYEPCFPAELEILRWIQRITEPRLGLRMNPFYRSILRHTFTASVKGLGLVVDASYNMTHAIAMRRYWSQAFRDGLVRPLALATEAETMFNETQSASAADFYREIHSVINHDPRIRVLVDPNDRLLEGQERWGGPCVTALEDIGHNPLDVARLDPRVLAWLLGNIGLCSPSASTSNAA